MGTERHLFLPGHGRSDVVAFDPKRVAEETKFLKKYPQFDEKPASIREFLGEEYLNVEGLVRPGLLKALEDIFGAVVNTDRIALVERAMVTGAIGIGKTTFASIALPYMAHWILCLRNPQQYFGFMPGSRIAFMQMSTSARQATEVVFGDLFARIKNSPWFIDNYPFDERYEKQIRFKGKDIWILPGDSTETSFEGYNILGGILDEMDSHKQTEDKDYADVGYETIHSRIASRFPIFGSDGEDAGHRGLLICIGQMKKSNGFAMRKFREFSRDPRAHVVRMTIWESFGWNRYTRKDGTRASFWYDAKRKKIIPDSVVGIVSNPDLMEIPLAYKKDFEHNPEKALRDLAGIPPATNSPFISRVDAIEACRDRWVARFKRESPVQPDPTQIIFEPWFRVSNQLKRVVHLDFGLTQDAFGFAMGHVSHLVTRENEEKPYIIIDCLARIKAFPGQQVQYADVRRAIYHLKDDLGFRIVTVTKDGFQSVDTEQQLRRRKFHVEDLSMDKSMLGYEDLREAIYEERLEFPPYKTYINVGDTDEVEIAISEIMQLQFTGKKVDHPTDGSKDVADGIAGVVTTLMGDRTYRRGVLSGLSQLPPDPKETGTEGAAFGSLMPMPTIGGLSAPLPPTGVGMGVPQLPARLQPKGKTEW
jgi:hypothetical protein